MEPSTAGHGPSWAGPPSTRVSTVRPAGDPRPRRVLARPVGPSVRGPVGLSPDTRIDPLLTVPCSSMDALDFSLWLPFGPGHKSSPSGTRYCVCASAGSLRPGAALPRLGLISLRPRILEGDAYGVMVAAFLTPDHRSGGVPAAARTERREEQDQRLRRSQARRRDRPDAAPRNVQNVQPDQPMRVFRGGRPPDRLNRHSDDRPSETPAILAGSSCPVHGSPCAGLCRRRQDSRFRGARREDLRQTLIGRAVEL